MPMAKFLIRVSNSRQSARPTRFSEIVGPVPQGTSNAAFALKQPQLSSTFWSVTFGLH